MVATVVTTVSAVVNCVVVALVVVVPSGVVMVVVSTCLKQASTSSTSILVFLPSVGLEGTMVIFLVTTLKRAVILPSSSVSSKIC